MPQAPAALALAVVAQAAAAWALAARGLVAAWAGAAPSALGRALAPASVQPRKGVGIAGDGAAVAGGEFNPGSRGRSCRRPFLPELMDVRVFWVRAGRLQTVAAVRKRDR